MKVEEDVFVNLVKADTLALLNFINLKLRHPVKAIDFILVVEEVESHRFFFNRFYPDLLFSALADSFKAYKSISEIEGYLSAVEKTMGRCLYPCGIILVVSSMFFHIGVPLISTFLTSVIGLIIARKFVNRRLQITKSRLEIVVYLMERN